MTYKYCCIFIKIILKIKSKEQNEQKPNGSTRKMTFEEFKEKSRLARVKAMNELHEKRMKEYREKKNQSPESQK